LINIYVYCRKANFDCPKCGINISESKLTEKSPDEIFADVDTYHRRKVKEVFNKREEDFDASEEGADEYRAYEELVEDLIFNLNNGIDVEQTWKRINDYKASNASTIIAISERNNYELIELERVISEKEKERKSKHLEYEKIDSVESKKSKDEARQRNSALLGDKITYKSLLDTSKPAGLTESQAASHPNSKESENRGPNFAAALLFHRQPPRVLRGGGAESSATDSIVGTTRSAKHDRAVHLAGGYDYIEYTKRNWQEIVNGIGWIYEQQIAYGRQPAEGEQSRWLVPWI
jgi:hypothetical protein